MRIVCYCSYVRTNQVLPNISDTTEDYIRAIFLLQNSEKEVSVTVLADILGLRKSTVSERLKGLMGEKLVSAPHYGKISLTPLGYKVGKKLTYNVKLPRVVPTLQPFRILRQAFHWC